MAEDNDLLNHLLRHLAPLLFVLEKGSQEHTIIVTAFAFSVADNWLLVTAGHCLKEVERLVNSDGFNIAECSLVDYFGSQARFDQPIPFSYMTSKPKYFGDYLDNDYGVIPLSTYYRELLVSNGIQPLTEEVWDKQPQSFEAFMMLGIPWQLSQAGSDSTKVTAVLVPVHHLEDRPPEAPETEFPIFYGRLPQAESLTDIAGMSGGPIFGFRRDVKLRSRYWLVALQSHWIPSTRTILAAPTRIFGQFVRDYIASEEYSGAP